MTDQQKDFCDSLDRIQEIAGLIRNDPHLLKQEAVLSAVLSETAECLAYLFRTQTANNS